MRKRHSNGQLRSLGDRMTGARKTARETKHEYRRLVSLEHARTRGMAMGALMVLQRGFWGRLKWLLVGR